MTTHRSVTDALDVTCPDHWHCDPALAPHACDRPNRSQPCPQCSEAPRPVTGPGGSKPITDEQIRRLKRITLGKPEKTEADRALIHDCVVALTDRRAMAFGMPGVAEGVRLARARCAAIINARMAGKETP